MREAYRRLCVVMIVTTLTTGTSSFLAAQTPSSAKPKSPESSAPAATTPPSSKSVSSLLGVYVFPAKGQSSSQQTLDEKSCLDWAHAQTGIDPVALLQSAPTQAQSSEQTASEAGNGERAKGAVRGAAAGAAIGAIAGDTGKGAAIGATAGTFQGGRKKREAQEQEKAQQQEASASDAKTQKDSYKKAFSACLEAKEYTVK